MVIITDQAQFWARYDFHTPLVLFKKFSLLKSLQYILVVFYFFIFFGPLTTGSNVCKSHTLYSCPQKTENLEIHRQRRYLKPQLQVKYFSVHNFTYSSRFPTKIVGCKCI
jgi:hypothetical protein